MALATPPTQAALTAAGYTLTGGLTYNKTFGTVVVVFASACPVEQYGTPTNPPPAETSLITVAANGDVTASDWANVAASLASLGVSVSGSDLPLTAAGGETFIGLTL